MTTLPRDRATRLIVALAMAAVIALPRAALADDQFDKMRAQIVAFVGDKMEKLGGSRIIYEVDSCGLRECVVTDLSDDVYKNLHDGHIAFSNLATRDGGVDVKIADAKGRDQLARKLVSAADGLPSHALAVTDGGDGAVRLAPTQSGTPPEGSEVLLGFKDKKPYLVAKESALDGEDISYAAPGFAAGTKVPVAMFHFNGHGTRRFAHVTEENVGKPFAILLDDKAISAPVIREPITGGSGQISGNFTLEEANSVAMLLRAGSLPGHLNLIEQQVIQPTAKP